MSKVKRILEERGNTHGSYEHIVNARAAILEELTTLYKHRHPNKEVPTVLEVMWSDVILKLVRSSANPQHQDNWDDLAGYSIIIQELMDRENALALPDSDDDEQWRHA